MHGHGQWGHRKASTLNKERDQLQQYDDVSFQ